MKGKIDSQGAAIFACVLGSLGMLVLLTWVNALTAWLTLASLVGYAFIYTLYLKRATPQNIVIGGLAGAMPPLLVGRRSPIRLMVTPPAGAHYFCVDAAPFLGAGDCP